MNAKTQYQLAAAEMEVILAVTRAGTLADAGMRLGVDGSTVFRSIQRMEKGMGQRLFERTRSGYRPNEVALQLAQHAERIEAEMEAARTAAFNPCGAVTGVVRITTTDTVLHHLIMPTLKDLALTHPLLQFELDTSNELANLTKRDADIAVRATTRPPDHLVGRHVGPIRTALFGPKGKNAKGLALADWSACPWIGLDDAMPEHRAVKWRKRHYPKAPLHYKVNSVQAIAEAVAAGLGIGMLPLFLARERRDLVQLSDVIDECETQLWLLTHPESRHLRRISTVFAHLAERLFLS